MILKTMCWVACIALAILGAVIKDYQMAWSCIAASFVILAGAER